MDDAAVATATYLVDLPLQVKPDGIYWRKSSGSSAESNHLVEQEEEEICIWRRHQQFVLRDEDPTSPWYDLTKPLLHTQKEEGSRTAHRINESELLEIILHHEGNGDCAKHVAMISNDHRPKLTVPITAPEMAYQQLVFPPITGLLYSFDPALYAADSTVYTGIFTYKDRHGNRKQLTGIHADAALTFSEQHLVLAMLALEKAGRDHDDSMQKCVLMTSISALALVREGVVRSVTIPFVVNMGVIARLFTTTVEHGNACPAIKIVFQANMSDPSDTAQMVAYLAVILHKLKQDVHASARTLDVRLVLDTFRAASSRSTSHQQASSNRTESMGGASDPLATDRREDREAQDVAAAEVASCHGEVVVLRGASVLRQLPAGGGRHRGGSPFYFCGVISSPRLHVFIKVWRAAADERRSQQRCIETEVRLLTMARQRGVPCPEVVDPLTKVNVSSSEHGLYHRLVMHRLADDAVRRDNVLPFAISLIKAVLKLHVAGILHCDIKPNNVLWNSFTKAASLADFGHAQEEVGATSYVGTVGFTAPKILRVAAPHSRLTDAYSVGRTLQHVSENVLLDSNAHHHQLVREAAAELTREDPSTRSTLERALQHVLHLTAGTRNHSLAPPLPSISIITPWK